MDLTRRHIFKLFFYWRLWISFPKLLWQLRGESPRHRHNSLEHRPNKTGLSLGNYEGWGRLENRAGILEGEWPLLHSRQCGAAGSPKLFCCHHFCFQIILSWEGEGWALLIQKNSKRTSDISSLLRMTECNWCAWCLANSNFLRTLLNVQTLFLDYWMPENNELAFSFGE